MPRPKKEPEVLERVKNMLGISWSSIIMWMFGILSTTFGFGLACGRFVAKMEFDKELMRVDIAHQRELHEENNKGRAAALEEMKQKNEQAQFILKIIETTQKK